MKRGEKRKEEIEGIQTGEAEKERNRTQRSRTDREIEKKLRRKRRNKAGVTEK